MPLVFILHGWTLLGQPSDVQTHMNRQNRCKQRPHAFHERNGVCLKDLSSAQPLSARLTANTVEDMLISLPRSRFSADRLTLAVVSSWTAVARGAAHRRDQPVAAANKCPRPCSSTKCWRPVGVFAVPGYSCGGPHGPSKGLHPFSRGSRRPARDIYPRCLFPKVHFFRVLAEAPVVHTRRPRETS